MRAAGLGCNVIDTAINYRHQRSERAVGEAVRVLIQEGLAARDELIVCTKGGFLPFDSSVPRNPRAYFLKEYVEPGIITPGDVAEGVHCMSPRYLEDQIERSLRNMNLECIDIYYLHNPETQLGEVAPGEFKKRLRSAFELLERKVSEGKIRLYGTATWNGYRTPPAVQEHLEIEEIAEIASEAGGGTHHFKVIQFPFNLSMVEAITLKNQTVTGTPTSLLEAADALGISTVASASLLQGRLAQKPPAFVAESLPGLETDAQRAIQFTRSAPGLGVALVGMSRVSHAEENLRLAAIPPAPLESYKKLFESER